ncbi:43812_t:CDS:2, partial [Gigaspora margarita]
KNEYNNEVEDNSFDLSDKEDEFNLNKNNKNSDIDLEAILDKELQNKI